MLNYEQASHYCATILIREYGFQKVEVQALKNELWLSHTSRKEFNLVRIYDVSLPDHNHQHSTKILEAISSIFQQKISFLELEMNQDETGVIVTDISTRISLNEHKIPDQFLKLFPKCSAIFDDLSDEQVQSIQQTMAPKAVASKKTFIQFIKALPLGTLSTSIFLVSISLILNGLSLLGYDIYALSIMFGAYYKTFIMAHFEIFRLFSYGFIHIDIFHLLMNTYALISLGNFMERIYGLKRFFVTIISGIIMGGLFVYVSQGNVLLVGISAGLFSLLGVLVVYLFETGLVRQPQIQTQLWRMVMMNVLISLIPGISVIGHIGGLITGVLIGLIYAKSKTLEHIKKHAFYALVLLITAVAGLAYVNESALPLYGITDQQVVDIADDFGLTWYAEDVSKALIEHYQKVSYE